jgi:hypothetical protein
MVTTSRHTDRARTHTPQNKRRKKRERKKKEIFFSFFSSSLSFTATNQTKGAREEQQNKENKEGTTKNSKFLSLVCRRNDVSAAVGGTDCAVAVGQEVLWTAGAHSASAAPPVFYGDGDLF